jgi:hypothetical protein
MDRLEGTYSVRSFGAQMDGETDDTGAIQEAINKATRKGGNVFLPPGRYLVKGSIEVKAGVTLYGIHEAPCGFSRLTGSVVRATGGRGKADADPLFVLHESSMVRGITVYYPEQDATDIQPYPWSFQMEDSDNTVECVTVINGYQGVRVGPGRNGRHRIYRLCGCLLRRGIWVDACRDTGRIDHCHFNPQWWSHASLHGDRENATAYVAEHLEALTFQRAQREFITNTVVHGACVGIQFLATDRGGFSGQMSNCNVTDSQTAIRIENLHERGVLFTGGEYATADSPDARVLHVEADCERGAVRFTNVLFDGCADLDGDCAASFGGCRFVGPDKADGRPLVVAQKGRLQLNHCSFDTGRTCLELGSEVHHAIVRGNNGSDGFRVHDRTGGRTIIGDNELPEA